MNLLDDPKQLQRLDPERMIDRILELPRQCEEAWNIVQGIALPIEYSRVSGVAVLGMGGSAIGGDLVRTLVIDELPLPFQVVRDYDLPAFAGENTLVIASSYSGNTEETLSAFQQAIDRGSKTMAITTGGRLVQMARSKNVPLILFSYKAQPRAALGYSFILLLGALRAAGLITDRSNEIAESVLVLRAMRDEMEPSVPESRNIAKQLARRLHERLPLIYGGGLLSEVARRWKGQMNENGKAWSFFEVLPELNHNAVVGYEYPSWLGAKVHVVFLDSERNHPRIRLRQEITKEILRQRGVSFDVVQSRGKGALAQMLSSVYVGDFVSYYLAILYGADPTPVKVISFLKSELEKVPG